jgi:pyruvate-formate lyase-activating enzyme
MRALSRVLPLTALTLFAPGCRKVADTFFVVNAETEEICKSQRNIEFTAAGPDTRTLTYIFEFPLGQLGADLPEGRLETDFRLRLFQLDVSGGGADLSGLEYARVSLRRVGAQEVIRTLLEYRQPSQAFSPTQLTLRGVEAASVAELAREDRLELVFETQGTLPARAWTADILACAGLRAEVHYFNFIF